MSRQQSEKFAQDRLGNVNRELDEVRAQAGMEDGEGITSVPGSGTDQIAYELPDDVTQVHLLEVHAHNSDSSSGTFNVSSATLDSNGNINTTTQRSVPIEVTDGNTRIHSYTGREFDEDAIVVSASFSGTIGLGIMEDRPEEYEPYAEQEEAP